MIYILILYTYIFLKIIDLIEPRISMISAAVKDIIMWTRRCIEIYKCTHAIDAIHPNLSTIIPFTLLMDKILHNQG